MIASFILHGGIVILLTVAGDWSFPKAQKKLMSIEAHLVAKKERKKDLLPKKPPVSNHQETIIKENEKPKEEVPKKAEDKPVPVAKTSTGDVKKKPVKEKPVNDDYRKKLQSLSQSFAAELAKDVANVPEVEAVEQDHSYFDQVYSLIKKSFVVPPHINGPQGHQLQAVVRLFLASDGSLSKLDLESPSGDEQFDQAVMDGTKRVSSFGAVPIFLQNALRERGLVVELCPFKCAER